MNRLLVALVFLCIAAAPASQPAFRLRPDTPEDQRKAITALLAYRERRLSELRPLIESANEQANQIQAARIVSGYKGDNPRIEYGKKVYIYKSVGERSAAAAAVAEKARAASDEYTAISLLDFAKLPEATPATLKDGFVGTATMGVLNVAGERDALVKVSRLIDMAQGYSPPRFVDESTTFWLTGISTAGLTTDPPSSIKTLIVVSGSKTYPTVAGGSRTVLLARPLELDKWLVRQ